ncbi:MAG: hypothetical protein ACRDRH_15780 [Pseudonocardia sp.]
MSIYALGDPDPEVRPDTYAHPDAVVIGNVASWSLTIIGAGVTIGHGVPIEGGNALISAGIDRGKRFRAELRLLER